MANRYWVGGTNTWNATLTGKWATTDGGTPGAAVPTTSDDVFFTALSGAVVVTTGATITFRSLNFTGFTGTFAGTNPATWGAVGQPGDITLSAGMTYTYTGAITLAGTTAVCNLTTAGLDMKNALTVNQSNTSFKLLDNWTSTGTQTITHSRGTFDTNNKNITIAGGTFNGSATNVRTLTLGSSTLSFDTWTMTTVTNLTFNVGTSTIAVTGGNFASGGLTYNIVDLSTATYVATSLSQDLTTATFIANGNNDNTQRGMVLSGTQGTQRTITATTVTVSNMDFRDIIGAGAGTWAGTSLGDCGNNSGITFVPRTLYWVHTSGTINFYGGNRFALTSGGATGQPQAIPGDTVIFDASSFPVNGTVSITINGWRIPTMDWSLATNKATFQCANRDPAFYGSLTLSSAMNLSFTSAANISFRGSGSQTLTLAGNTFAHTGTTTFGHPTGTYTLNDAFVNTGTTAATISGAGTVVIASSDIQVGTFTVGNGATFTHNGGTLILTDVGVILSLNASSTVTMRPISITNTAAGNKTLTTNGNTLSDIAMNHNGTVLLTGNLNAGAITINQSFKQSGYFDAQGNTVTATSYKDYTQPLAMAG